MNRRLWIGCWTAIALFIVYGSLVPFHLDLEASSIRARLARVRVDPLISPDTGRRPSIPDVVQNALLFAPFGLFGVWALEPRRSCSGRVARVAVFACGLSVVCEALQLLTFDRVTSTTDVVASVAGATVAAVAAARLTAVPATLNRFLRDATRTRWGVAAIVSWALVLLFSWEPFDVTLDVGTIWSRLKALRLDPWQRPPTSHDVASAVPFFLFGFFTVQWLRDRRAPRPVLTGLVTATAAAVALEATQLIVESRMPGLAGAIVAGISAAAGVLTAGTTLVQSLPRAVAITCGAILVLIAIDGLSVTSSATLPMNVISRTIECGLLNFAFGFSVPYASAASPQRQTAIATITALAVAAFLVYARLWLGEPARLTDIAVSGLAAYAGAYTGLRGTA